MCTRILNNIDSNWVTTARSFDWELPLSSSAFRSPVGAKRIGLSTSEMDKAKLKPNQVLEWEVKYPSLSILIGTDAEGYGMTDGLNSKGLTVNVLYDSTTTLAKEISPTQKAISLLRWGQYILDTFPTVKSAVADLQSNNLFFINGLVPGDDEADTELYLTLADESGDSAVIDIKDGKMVIHHGSKFTVTTNQPDYETQLNMMNYWLYQWNLGDTKNIKPVYTVPGGTSSVQRFERTCFYRLLTNQKVTSVNRVAQVKGMVGTCSIPLHFSAPLPIDICKLPICDSTTPPDLCERLQNELEEAELGPYTIWTGVSDASKRKYYFFDTMHSGSVWFDIDTNATSCKMWLLSNKNIGPGFMGNGDNNLRPCSDPFAK